MINEESIIQLRELNLPELVDILKDGSKQNTFTSITFDESMEMIIAHLYSEKISAKIERLIRIANFRDPTADFTNLVYEDRKIDSKIVAELASLEFIKNHTNVICEGFTGNGKTFFSNALGKEACKKLLRTKYIRQTDLLLQVDIRSMKTDGYIKLLNQYTKYDLLILDEWLMGSLKKGDIEFMFELIERRYQNHSTVFCTQYKQEEWRKKLGSSLHSEAIIDRIIHNSITLTMGKTNMREKLHK
jgi:DNA replication protein DnaC